LVDAAGKLKLVDLVAFDFDWEDRVGVPEKDVDSI
jgi:hypothetical protein